MAKVLAVGSELEKLMIQFLVSQELLDTVLGIRKDEDDSQGEVTDGDLSDPDGNTDRT